MVHWYGAPAMGDGLAIGERHAAASFMQHGGRGCAASFASVGGDRVKICGSCGFTELGLVYIWLPPVTWTGRLGMATSREIIPVGSRGSLSVQPLLLVGPPTTTPMGQKVTLPLGYRHPYYVCSLIRHILLQLLNLSRRLQAERFFLYIHDLVSLLGPDFENLIMSFILPYAHVVT